jgi:hypothetical protein
MTAESLRTAAALLGNGRVAMAVAGPKPTIEHLREYFHPWLQSARGGTVIANIRMRTGDPPSRHASCQGRLVERLRNENTGRVWYAEERILAGRTVFVLDEHGAAVSCDRATGGVEITAISADGLFWAAKDIVQRQILQPAMQQTTALIHGAGIAINGATIIITGRKGAGKTTVQFMLATAGAAFVSADRVFIGNDHATGKCHAWGYPARSSVDRASMSMFPSCGPADGFAEDGKMKVLIPLAELARRFRTSLVPSGPLAAIVLCRREGGRYGLLRRVPPQAVSGELSDSWFQRTDPIVPRWLPLLPVNDRQLLRTQAEVLERLCATVPVLELDSDAARDIGPELSITEVERAVDGPER